MLVSLPDCILHKITDFTGLRPLGLVRCSNKELNARVTSILCEVGAKRIRRFWKWCRLFAITPVVTVGFQRCKLSSAAEVTAMR